ncbi:MAG: gluconate 2-dehydrogenase subunit 3 family protein [Bryobacteraceae bacterium]
MPLELDRKIFRAVVFTIVPESVSLDETGWNELEHVVETLLSARPESLKRQLRTFLKMIQWLPVVRYAKPFTSLDAAARTRVLNHLQNDRIQKIRVGFWGLRTMVMAGFYARRRAAAAIGYAASPAGWEAIR